MVEDIKWHEDRLNGIGGSEASTVLGINPWQTRIQLYNKKVERKIDLSSTDNIRFKLGHVLEPLIADEYAKRTGYILETRPIKIHPDHSFMFANIDRHITIVGKDNEHLLSTENIILDRGILEIKTKGAFINWEGDVIPSYYITQAQHYMSVYEYNWVDFAVLDFLKFEIKITRVKRDEEFIKKLRWEEAKFWDLVQNKTPPEIELSHPVTEEYLKELFNTSEHEIIDVTNNEEATENALELKNIKESYKDLEEIELSCKNYFMNLMKEADTVIGNGFKFTLKNNKDSTEFDKEKFKEDNPILYNKYLIPKKGARVFRTKFDKE